MGNEVPQAANGFVRVARKVYNPIGFKKGYNFTLWFIFAGAVFGFVLARLQYLSIDGKFHDGAIPGEWYWMRSGYRRIGITLHLATILPAGLLILLQFTPIIRHKAILFHRVNGYVILLLLLLSNAGALMLARHSVGGGIETQSWIGLLVIITTISAALAYYNIKRIQIDQHRAWMLRTWFYACSIITLRIIMIISVIIISQTGGYYHAMQCDEIAFIYADKAQEGFRVDYPQCFTTNGTTDGWVAVSAKLLGSNVPRKGSAFDVTFGTAGWIALVMHAVGVEIYLRLTPRENNRLRVVSYQRQLEAGFSHPGSSGLTADRLGDADPWQPPRPDDSGK
ncbi:hypothetical protein BDR22DRAFT_881406 [Usnea florida]